MEINMPLSRIAFIIFVIVMFMAIGWMLPVLYTAHAPSSHFFVVHEMETQNVTVGDDSHYFCLDRTVRRPGTADNHIEIRRVEEDGSVSRAATYLWDNEGYFEEGHQVTEMEFPIPNDLEEGQYVYKITATFTYDAGRAQRTFLVTSAPFWVKTDESAGDDWTCNET